MVFNTIFNAPINAIAGGAGIANTTKLSDTQKEKLLQVAEQKLTQEQIQNSISKMVMKGMSEALVQNKSEISAMVEQDNKLFFGTSADLITAATEGLTPEGKAAVMTKLVGCPVNIRITGVRQTNVSEMRTAVSTKNEIATKLSNEMKKGVKQQMEAMQNSMKNANLGSTFGDVANTIGQTVSDLGKNVETVVDGSLGGAGIANNYDQTKVSEKETELQNLFSIENRQITNQDDQDDVSMNNELNNENVTKIVNEILQANDLKADAICPENIDVSQVEQINMSNLEIQSETMSKISVEIGQKATRNIEKFLTTMQENQETETVGDIQQLGTATAAALVAGGEAVATASEGIGTGLSNFLGGNMIKYIMIGIAVIALIAGFVFIIRPDAASSTIKGVSADMNRGPPPGYDMGPPPDMGQGMGPDSGYDMGPEPQYNKYLSHYLN